MLILQVVVATIQELVRLVEDTEGTTTRILQKGGLLHFLAELCRTYPQAAELISHRKCGEVYLLQWLLEKLMLDNLRNTELQVATKAVFVTLLNVHNTPECNSVVVEVVRDTLANITHEAATKQDNEAASKAFCERISALAKFLSLLKECSQVSLASLG